jgi:hypothetical protein
MAGARGRSGGWNKKSVEEHLATGTFRRDRHAGALALATAAHRDPDERATRRLLSGLSRSSQALARRLLSEFEGWTPADLVPLRLALEALDRVAECRERVAAEGLTVEECPHPLLRVERHAATFATAVFRQLGLRGRS